LYKKPLTKEPLIINKRSINLEATNNISNAIKAINWQYLEHMNIDDAYLNFTQELTNILDKFAPETKISIPASCIIRDPWMSKGLLKSSKTLNKLYKQKLNKDKTHPTHIKYLQYRNMYNKLKRETKLTYYDDLFKKYKNDIRKTWSVLNSLIGRVNDKSTISDTFKINNCSITNKYEIANEFCEYFTNVGLKYANNIPKSKFTSKHFLRDMNKQSMFMAPTDQEEINKTIDIVKRKNSAGHDNVSSSLLKDIKVEISQPLEILFNKSLQTGHVPDLMKLAKVIPIYKSKNKEIMNNYRPISLLPIFSKLLEKIVHKRLYNFFNSQSILYPSQYGFRPNHSTNHAIHEFVDGVTASLENKQHTLSVFLDLSKAFDTIDHNILLGKLSWYGVRGKALDWFRSYLENRQQYVEYCHTESSILTVPCGVPQGSVLGPLLFIIYTNDLPNCLKNSKAILFADDTTIYISSNDTRQLYISANLELQSLTEWFRANKLSLNVAKTHYVFFRCNNADVPMDIDLNIGDDIIEEAHVAKFLGMFIDSKLDWNVHLDYVKNKLNSSLYAMRRVKHILSKNHLMTLYYSLIYPYIDYGITMWGSATKIHTNKITLLQKKAVRIISNARYNDHTEPLFRELKILKLDDIYKLKLNKFMFSLNSGLLPSPLSNMIISNRDVHVHYTRNRNNPHIEQRQTKRASNMLKHLGPTIWYQTPNNIKISRTIYSFTKRYKKMVLDRYVP